jgi:outer membrane protein assembly factor BamE (lipoprotein component of BamABCDE complex)
MTWRAILIGCLVVAITACATGERIVRLEPGMSKDNVVEIMGRPDGFKAQNGYEIFRYTNRLISGWSWDRADYNVIFKNSELVEYGAGEVRTKEMGTSTILFIAPIR